MRGKLTRETYGDIILGLIPAYAGKTAPLSSPWTPVPAHPRVCGENELSGILKTCLGGSSPRMRGKLTVHLAVNRATGLIPAYAGKTLSALRLQA